MPELPEVETIRRQLDKTLKGKAIAKVQVLSKKQFPQSPKLVEGEKILGVSRRAKLLIFHLSHNKHLISHLKLTGQFIWVTKLSTNKKIFLKKSIPTVGDSLPAKSTRVILKIGSGMLFFNDTRKFGWIKFVNPKQLEAELLKYGIEPFKNDFTLKNLEKALKTSRKPIKTVLLDQEKIAGIGNIYANDALYLSKIHPALPANQLNLKQVKTLKNNLEKVLKLGLKYGGASDEHYIHPDLTYGSYQNHFFVYGKQGKPCSRCKTLIKRIVIGGRGTFVCEECQILK